MGTESHNDTVSTGKKPRLLLVDDDDLGRDSIKMLLVYGGFSVEAVASAEEALVRLEGQRVDCVITDHCMPGMKGEKLAEIIKQRYPSLPVVMFSGCPPERPMPSVDLLLRKPHDISVMRDSVRGILERKSPAMPG
jgi:CheY-like chemotaxis protein